MNNVATALLAILMICCTLVPVTKSLRTEENEQKNIFYIMVMAVVMTIFLVASTLWFLNTILTPTSVIKQILQYKYLVPISRLSYTLYLLNAIPIWFTAHQNRQPPTLTLSYLVTMLLCSIQID